MTSSSQLLLGSCPDSWGVWFADDPRQTPWDRFLDELAEVGYEWLELGPYGYLPTDPAQLSDELARRGLRVSGGTVVGHSGLHRADDWPDVLAGTREVAELTAGVGGKHVVLVLVPGFRDDTTGAYTEPAELDVGGRKILTRSADELGKVIGEEWHMDLAWMEKPPGITMLYGHVIPPVGGDTCFASLEQAYLALSPGMKR